MVRYHARVKSAAVIALLASGCTFSIQLEPADGPPAPDDARADAAVDAAIDAPPLDAILPIDASPDAMPDWVQIDMISVPCIGTEIMSSASLAAGTMYRLRATGTCIANDGDDVRGDAEYIYNNFGTVDSSGGVDMGIAVNDTTPGTEKLPRWGSYTNTHVYSAMWVGLGATVVVKYHDPNYNNNSGELTLFIDAFQ